ncbi:CBS domain-containing protein [Candidatus Woesearchaeota archaeon]|nr:CBS domain-containing protein [Candidatus Woesearchaeota archaeon]
MHPELSEIKRLRKLHGLTQSGLAKLANVSQSLIAKIESGRIDPAYTNVKRIFEVLGSISEQKEHRAEEIMVRKIISCSSSDSAATAIKKMKLHEVSQLPVIDRSIAVGLVTESNLLDLFADGKGVSGVKVAEVMQDAPPVISRKTPLRIVIDLLRYSPLVTIADNGRFEGVVTKSDVLRFRASG